MYVLSRYRLKYDNLFHDIRQSTVTSRCRRQLISVMLTTLPIELQMKILQFLPSHDLSVITRTSKDLSTISAAFLTTAHIKNLAQCRSLFTYLVADATCIRAQRLRDIQVAEASRGDAAEFARTLVHIFELASKITQLSICGFDIIQKAEPRFSQAVTSLPSLLHLSITFAGFSADRERCIDTILQHLPSGLQSLAAHDAATTLAFRLIVSPLVPRLAHLHSLTLNSVSGFTDGTVSDLTPLSSVLTLKLTSTTVIHSLSAIFHIFPRLRSLCIDTVSLRDFGESACPSYVRLPHFQAINCRFPPRWTDPNIEKRLQVAWIELTPSFPRIPIRVASNFRTDDVRHLWGVARDMCDGFPLGVTMDTLMISGGFWEEVYATMPNVRWMEVRLDSVAAEAAIAAIVRLPRSCVLQLGANRASTPSLLGEAAGLGAAMPRITQVLAPLHPAGLRHVRCTCACPG